MGHRFSKTAANNIASTATAGQEPTRSHELRNQTQTTTVNSLKQPVTFATTTTTRRIPIPNGNSNFVGPTINLQIQESPSGIGGIGATCHNNNSSTHTATAAASILQQPSSSSIGCSSNSSSLTSVNNLSCGRQIIIKIQLAKMENGNEISASASTSPALLLHQQQQQDISLETLTADCNLNSSELRATTTTTGSSNTSGVLGAAQNLKLTLNGSSSDCSNNMIATATTTAQRTAGSSSSSSSSSSTLATNNNYLNPSVNNSSTNFASSAMEASSTMSLSERLGRFNNTLQFNDETVEQNLGEIVEYCEVLEDQHQPPLPLAINEEPEIESNVCCRRKSKSLAANGGAASSSSKRRCRKCSCRDAFRRILDPSLSRSSNKAQKQQQQQLLEQERKEQKQQSRAHERHSIPNLPINRSANALQQMQRNSMHSTNSTTATASFVVPSTVATTVAAAPTSSSSANQVAVWGTATTANGSDVIIPLTTPPQFVVVQCAIVNPTPAANNTHHHHHQNTTSSTVSNSNLPNSIISITHNTSPSSSSTASSSNNEILVTNYRNVPQHPQPPSIRSLPPTTAPIAAAGPIVHSHVDFVHYLVPDLERITNSSFYWGKMDRYEAERLLEGKPEGTFLLRDSAQEEFLFSVTFRKYGRSLHARIEQSGHRFSFDCHDPCVFTASTVTGLLEHYKDPACVMFFEPMLTIPLHRGNCFSLQQQCRATIVSNTTYDGINELELPARLKSYLKEYHYKQKLRVKLNEPTYTIHCK